MTRKMKDSGIEWIGEIPEDWEVVRIRHKARVASSGLSLDKLLENGQFAVYDANNLVGYIDENPVKDDYISIIKDGAGVGRTRLMPKNTNVIGTMNYIVANKIDLNYLFYALQVFDFEQYSTGSTIPHIYFKDYGNEYIALPNQEIQKNIVKILNYKVRKIYRLMERVSEQIQTLEDYKKSVITEAVTKGLDKNVEMKDSGIEWIGEIPKYWKVKRLKQILSNDNDSLKVGPFGSSLKSNDLVDSGKWVYNQRTVLDNNFNSNDTFIDDKKFIELKGFKVKAGDILLTTRGTIGKVAIVPNNFNEGVIHPCIIKFNLNKDIFKNDLIKFIFNHTDIVLRQVEFLSNSTTIGVIYSYNLVNIYIPIPSISEQEQIIEYLDKKTKLIDQAIESKQKQLEVLEEYKKSLIYEYVTGKKEVGDAHCSFR